MQGPSTKGNARAPSNMPFVSDSPQEKRTSLAGSCLRVYPPGLSRRLLWWCLATAVSCARGLTTRHYVRITRKFNAGSPSGGGRRGAGARELCIPAATHAGRRIARSTGLPGCNTCFSRGCSKNVCPNLQRLPRLALAEGVSRGAMAVSCRGDGDCPEGEAVLGATSAD